MRVISGLIATGEFLFPLSLTQIIVYVISGSQSSIFAIFFLGYHGAGPQRASQVSLGPYRYHLNPGMLIVTLGEPNVK